MSGRSVPFVKLITDSLANQWVSVRTPTVQRLVVITFLWAAILIGLAIAAPLSPDQAAFTPVISVGTVLFFGLLTASWITIAVTQVKQDVHGTGSQRRHVAQLIATVPTILIAALLMWSSVSLAFVMLAPRAPSIVDYASCTTNGGLVLQTNPAQCITTTNTFTDPRGVQ